MAVLTLTGFKGEAPSVHPALLPDGFAQSAVATRHDSGALKPMNASSQAHDLGVGTYGSIQKHLASWLGFSALTHGALGPVDDSRLYYTTVGDTPKMRLSDGTVYDLALPAPTAACAALAQGTLDENIAVTRVYTYTYVTAQGEESQPAALSNEQLYSTGMTASLSGIVAAPAGRGITSIRIYMSETSALGVTDLYFVDEIASNLTSYTHDPATDPIQEPIPSMDYDTPLDTMRGIISLPNGMMAAFSGRTLCFSEPYIPHAWPIKYQLKTDYEIVGLAAFGTTIAVMTVGTPYIVQGNSPDSMVMERIEETLACVSAAGIVDMGYAAIYPSQNGLVMISGEGPRLITKGVYDRKQWGALKPETIVAGAFDGKYVFTYDQGAGRKGALLDILGATPWIVKDDIDAEAFWSDPLTADLYYLDSANLIQKYDDDAAALKPYSWRSKLVQFPVEQTKGVLVVEGEAADAAPSMTVNVYYDGVLVRSVSTLNTLHRLPPTWFKRLEIEAVGNATISRILVADTPDDLAGM